MMPKTRRRWPTPKRLSTRIVAGSVALLLVVQLLVGIAISSSIERNARAGLAEQLRVGENYWHELLDQKSKSLLLGARLLAQDFGFKAALNSRDIPTLESALENNADRIDASVSAYVDTQFEVKALFERDGADKVGAMALRRIAAELTRSQGDRSASRRHEGRKGNGSEGGQGGTQVALVGGRPFQFVAVPLKAPLLVGWVVMGFPIDRGLVDAMRKLSSMDVALLLPGRGGAREVGISTLGAAGADAATAGEDRAVVGGEAMAVRRIALVPDRGAELLLLLSVDKALAPFHRLQAWLLLITVAGVAVFAVGSVFTARRVTTPLRSLASASERLGRGEYEQPLQDDGRSDEIGELARAFDHMRTNIGAQQAEIRQLAYWDRLTGLPNRARFRELLGQAIAQARTRGGTVSVLLLDLDRFKHVNDVLGYAFGDRLLQGVAERLRVQMVREGDIVARLSGDEFAVLLPGSDAQEALGVAERIADVFLLPMTLDDHTVDLAAGFGIATWPTHASDADVLLGRAEVAMYTAKRKTTSAMVYDPAIDAGSARSLSLLSELRQALENDELRLFLQPKIALAGAWAGRCTGAEALVRWQHPTRGMVPPMEFIPFAEQTGFVRQLTLWMLEATARQWPMLSALGLTRVSVNLSTRDLLDQELPMKLERIVNRHRMPAHGLCLEITESAIMDEPQRALATLNTLSKAGFKLSIDDFGTGYSSLAYLKRLPVDELKIDKSFVMAMERDESDAKIVRSTIDLAHNLGLTVVAEGVENANVLQRLIELQCDEAQGYHMSRPVPAAEMPAFAVRWARERAYASAAALH
jgi:diguanylate cyclase (GGDEF)-like protein